MRERADGMSNEFPRPYRAAIIGAGGGIGQALAARLANAGVDVLAFARRPGIGDGAVHRTMDIADETTIEAACRTIGPGAPIRLIVVATGLLHDHGLQPEKTVKALDAGHLQRSFLINAIGPALVAKHMLPLLPRDGKSVFAMLSARVGSIADNRLGGWYGYRASKAALNQIARTLAIEVGRSKPEAIVATLHPGTVATRLSAPFRAAVDPERLFTTDDAARHLLAVIEGLTPGDSGGFFAWDGAPIPF